jgi:hypothetical protein
MTAEQVTPGDENGAECGVWGASPKKVLQMPDFTERPLYFRKKLMEPSITDGRMDT